MGNRNNMNELSNMIFGLMDGLHSVEKNYPVMDIYSKSENDKKVLCYEIAMPGIPRENVLVSIDKLRNIVIVENNFSEQESDERRYMKHSIAKRKFKTELRIPIGYKLSAEKSNFSESILHLELVPMDESENPIERVEI